MMAVHLSNWNRKEDYSFVPKKALCRSLFPEKAADIRCVAIALSQLKMKSQCGGNSRKLNGKTTAERFLVLLLTIHL